MNIAERFADPSVHQSAAVDLALADRLDELIGELKLYLTRTAKVDDVQTYHRLQTIPGAGKVLALILLYEMHDVQRFDSAGQFLSYARLVRCSHESAGKKLGSGGKKIGNAHLRWALAATACLFLRCSARAKKWKDKQAAQRGEGKALAILAARLGRAVYHMLRKREAFDEERFWQGGRRRTATGASSLLPKEERHAGDGLSRSAVTAAPGGSAGTDRLRAVPALAGSGAWSVPGAWVADAAQPVVRGASEEGRVALLPLRCWRQLAGFVAGGDAPDTACRSY
jgi:hypothetical protein